MHGWAGLTWISYPHVAIPIGGGLFIVWLALAAPLPTITRRVVLACAAALYACVAYYIAGLALQWHFATGPSAMIMSIGLSRFEVYAFQSLIYLLYPLLPIGACLIGRMFGVRITLRDALVSVMVTMAACPIAMVLLAATKHIGGADEIHTIKSGFIVPLLVIGLGLPFLPPRAKPPAGST